MKTSVRQFFKRLRREPEFRTVVWTSVSWGITLAFALYNGGVGLLQRSIWNGSICVYYLLLTVLRGMLLDGRRRPSARGVFIRVHVLLLAMNVLLIVPIALMARNQKPVIQNQILSIAIAAYTTYKVVLAVWNMRKSWKADDLLRKALRTIHFVDAIVAVMSLQTTLITVNGSAGDRRMLRLSAYTNAGMFAGMMLVSTLSFVRGLKGARKPHM